MNTVPYTPEFSTSGIKNRGSVYSRQTGLKSEAKAIVDFCVAEKLSLPTTEAAHDAAIKAESDRHAAGRVPLPFWDLMVGLVVADAV